MASDNIVHQILQECPFPPNLREVHSIEPSAGPLPSVFRTIEVDEKRPPAIPKPMAAWCRNERNPLAPHSGVQIDSADSLEKLLFQKPFLHPNECCIVILDSDHQRSLLDEPFPNSFGNGTQIDAHATDDHQQQSARCKLILATKNVI